MTKDQNEISDLIFQFKEKAGINFTEHDLFLLNYAFSWLFNIRGIKPSDNWPI